MILSLLITMNMLMTSGLEIEKNRLSVESSYDSLQISVLEMRPEQPKAVVYLVHGLCGCKERFIPFMEYLAENGIACVASDHRGHGDSVFTEDDRGYTYQGGAKAIVMDMDVVSSHISENYKDIPFIILGHSMGSLAIRAYLKSYDERLDGMIICGSPTPDPLAPIGKAIVRNMCRKDARMRPDYLQKFAVNKYNRKFRKEGKQAWTCSDPQVRRQFAEDPRCNYNITVDCAYTLFELYDEAYSIKGWNVTKPQLPIIFLSGDDDPCMISKGKFYKSVDKMKRNGYYDVRCATYPGMRHEILNEIGKESVWSDILTFIGTITDSYIIEEK